MCVCVCVCVRLCVCVSVCSGGLFDDQFQEFGISVCLRFKERRKKVKKKERGGKADGEGQRRG